MKTEVIAARELDQQLTEPWEQIQREHSELDKPFLCPQFTQAVASVRDDVFVSIMHENGTPVGFLPYQRTGRAARPVGGPLSDYQAVIIDPGRKWVASDLIAASGLRFWDFDHLLACQQPLQQHHVRHDESPVMDLSSGYEAYAANRAAAGTKQLKQIEASMHRIARQIGPLRFEARSVDPQVLRQLFAWKSAQYQRRKVLDIFAFVWVRDLLAQLMTTNEPGFAGMASTLHAGDRLIAVHMGMRSATVWHYWFPAFDASLRRYSPGLCLLMQMARSAPELGISTIDLGNGDEQYKSRLATGAVPIARGWVRASRLSTAVGAARRNILELARASGMAAYARSVEQKLRMARFQ